jgi:GNAT superfamily N-acetyltransferase
LNRQIEKLQPRHVLDAFDCGQPALNNFLQKHALASQYSDGAQTYVGLVDDAVVGYYSLVTGSVEPEQAPERVKKGLARRQSIPIMLLARLAVDRQWQRKGIGAALLKDAMLRTVQAADIVGIRSLVVHAKDNEAKKFYLHFDFVPSPTDPLHLFILVKDPRKLVRAPRF